MKKQALKHYSSNDLMLKRQQLLSVLGELTYERDLLNKREDAIMDQLNLIKGELDVIEALIVNIPSSPSEEEMEN